MAIRGVNSKGKRSSRFRVSQHRNSSKTLFGVAEGGVKHRGPMEKLSKNFEGIGEKS